jgi:hypothetical protein
MFNKRLEHLCTLISPVEKRGFMDSIFIGYKVIPQAELDRAEQSAESLRK